MKKLFLNLVAIMLLLAVAFPIVSNAATLEASEKNMKVGEIVYVTVKTEKSLESIQFDLKFDNTKYKFIEPKNQILEDNDLDSAMAHQVLEDTVRVSAVDTNLETTKEVVLEFEAIKTGTPTPFSITGVVELGENGEANATEKLDSLSVSVKKINGNDVVTDDNKKDDTYLDDNGNPIPELPKTAAKESVGIYKDLVPGETIVPYIFDNMKDTLTGKDIRNEYPTAVMSKADSDIIVNGDTFTVSGETFKVLIYGDVNKDGRITTSDALYIYKYADSLDEVQTLAADVNNDGELNFKDALNIQKFILNIYTPIAEEPDGKLPVISGLNVAPVEIQGTLSRNYITQVPVATFASNNNVAISEVENTFANTKVTVDGKTLEGALTFEVNDGLVTILVTPKLSGKYVITPVVEGANVKGGQVIASSTRTFDVVEDTTITRVKLINTKTNEVSYDSGVNGSILELGLKDSPEDFRSYKIEFYHDYEGGEPVDVSSANKNVITVTSNNTDVVNDITTENKIMRPVIDPDAVANSTVTLTLKTGTFEHPITAKTVELEKTKINLSANEVTVYTNYNADTIYVPNGTNTAEFDGAYDDEFILYTIIDISHLDEDGSIRKLQSNNVDISTTKAWNKINLEYDNDLLSVVPFVKEGNSYKGIKLGTVTKIDAIGIAVTDSYVEDTAQGLIGTTQTIKLSTMGSLEETITVDIAQLPLETNNAITPPASTPAPVTPPAASTADNTLPSTASAPLKAKALNVQAPVEDVPEADEPKVDEQDVDLDENATPADDITVDADLNADADGEDLDEDVVPDENLPKADETIPTEIPEQNEDLNDENV